MKLVSVVFFVVTAVLLFLLPSLTFLPFVFAVVFGAYGVGKSSMAHIDPLNDVPNALRVFLASSGGLFFVAGRSFFSPSLGILLLAAAIFLNDEYQRRAIHSFRTGTRGGSFALLGIDGSGKSTHSTATGDWLRRRGYTCTVMPFHRYIFVERLASLSSPRKVRTRRGGNPLRPVASLVDNLILQLWTSVGCRLEGRVVLYDRFIWSTFIKYSALGYPVRPLAPIYLSPRPHFAIVLDVPVEKSLRVIDERVQHTRYSREVLAHEREAYLAVARRYRYPIVDATASFESVQRTIESHLQKVFPPGRVVAR
jgi:dTMP kinase